MSEPLVHLVLDLRCKCCSFINPLIHLGLHRRCVVIQLSCYLSQCDIQTQEAFINDLQVSSAIGLEAYKRLMPAQLHQEYLSSTDSM